MSKGLGKMQRLVLDVLKTGEWMQVDDVYMAIYPGSHHDLVHSHCNSVSRAVKSLERRGMVERKWHYIGRKGINPRGSYKRVRIIKKPRCAHQHLENVDPYANT